MPDLVAQGDPREYATYLATRPPTWEQNAIKGLLSSLSKDIAENGPVEGGGFSLHIAHLADASCLAMIEVCNADCTGHVFPTSTDNHCTKYAHGLGWAETLA